MEWNLISLGVGLICLSIGISTGLYLPEELLTMYDFRVVMMIVILIFTVVGLASLVWGLRKK